MINYIEKGHGLHEAIRNAGYSLYQVDGVWVSNNDTEVQAIINDYNPVIDAKNEAKKRIREQSEAIAESIKGNYPDFEMQIWPYQRLEVEAWDLDKDAPTPTCDAVALARGLDRVEQLERTLAKTTAFKNFVNLLVGKKQYYEDLIESLNDVAEINAINFEL